MWIAAYEYPRPFLLENTMIEATKEVTVDNDVPDTRSRQQHEYQPEYTNIAARLICADFTEQDLAYAFDVSKKTIQKWKQHYPEFKAACEDGKREQKKRLVARAMKQAVGYDFTEKNVKRIYNAEGKLVKCEESEFNRHNPGNERMLVFLLCNLDRQLGDEAWQSVKQIEVNQKTIHTHQLDAGAAREQIKALAAGLVESERKQVESTVLEAE
jgi:hypothetical protein